MEKIINNIELLKEDLSCENIRIEHFIKDLGKYSANIICYEFYSAEELDNNWKEAVNNVALHIQSKVGRIIEAYNLYVFFFVLEPLKNQLIYTIEQDKYSSRKIVVKMSMPEEEKELKELINDKLFSFSIIKQRENIDIARNCIGKYSTELIDYLDKIEKIDDSNLKEVVDLV